MHRESTDLTSADRGATMARTGTMVGGRGPRVTTQAPRGVSVGEDDKGGGGQGTEDLAKVHAQVTESILMLINAIVGFPEELKVCDLARSRAISRDLPLSSSISRRDHFPPRSRLDLSSISHIPPAPSISRLHLRSPSLAAAHPGRPPPPCPSRVDDQVRVKLRVELIRLQLLDVLAALHRERHVEIVRQVCAQPPLASPSNFPWRPSEP